jgi:hypothetical protein
MLFMKIVMTMAFFAVLAVSVRADLLVTTEPVKVTGQKAVVRLDIRNTFKHKVESARAAVFLMDPQGVVVGHATQWVITGQKKFPVLRAGGTNQFNFVIPLARAVGSTNLTAKVQFERGTIGNGRQVNIPTEVSVTEAGK